MEVVEVEEVGRWSHPRGGEGEGEAPQWATQPWPGPAAAHQLHHPCTTTDR